MICGEPITDRFKTRLKFKKIKAVGNSTLFQLVEKKYIGALRSLYIPLGTFDLVMYHKTLIE